MLSATLGRAVALTIATGLIWGLNATTAIGDDVRAAQWPLQRYGVNESVWKQSQGEGVTVAVIDSGVNAAHQDLNGQVLFGEDFTGQAENGTYDQSGHGTAMASLIAGHGHGPDNGIMGLAPRSKVLPVRIVLGSGEPGSVPVLDDSASLAKAIRYSVDQGADVINMSLGASRADDQDREAVQYAIDRDVVLVAAAGNEGKSQIEYPAAYPGVVAVGAVDVEGKAWNESNSGPEVALSAPGEQIVSATKGSTEYGYGSGTSPATAYVSAAAALVRAKFPDLSAGQVINRLMKSAMAPPDGTKVPSEKYGAGILNPNQALSKDIPLGPKENPLLARASADDKESSAPPTADPGKNDADKAATAAEKPAEDDGLPIVLIVAGIGALIVAITAVAIVMTRRRPTY